MPESSPTPSPEQLCPLCGTDNQCAPAKSGSFGVRCWCARVTIPAEVIGRIPENLRGRACLCPRCAGAQDPSGADT